MSRDYCQLNNSLNKKGFSGPSVDYPDLLGHCIQKETLFSHNNTFQCFEQHTQIPTTLCCSGVAEITDRYLVFLALVRGSSRFSTAVDGLCQVPNSLFAVSTPGGKELHHPHFITFQHHLVEVVISELDYILLIASAAATALLEGS